ncbi:MAG: hypothetical protein ACJ8C4_08785 [Gemmataceae bacterium]
MGIPETSNSPASEPSQTLAASPMNQGWNPFSHVLLRFAFTYWLLYSLPVILAFPVVLASLGVKQLGPREWATTPPRWVMRMTEWISAPSGWVDSANNWLTPKVSQNLLHVSTESPTDPSGSGDRLFAYATAFTDLVLAIAITLIWSIASLLWRRWRGVGRQNYDRLNAWMRLIVRFHLMDMMIVYGAIKIWCGQFPPIGDFQLDAKYGDSSPMGLLWRFMQYSQPYTSATGIIEFTCGVLLISRRTTLLGAMLAAGATLQVFLLNMCYDVPVKLMSGHLFLMALTLIVADAPRLARFFVLGRPVEPRPETPLFGRWRRVERTAAILLTLSFSAFAAIHLLDAYRDAKSEGMLADENPVLGRWVGKEFIRDGVAVPFPEQPVNPPPQQFTPGSYKGGPGMPAVVRAGIGHYFVALLFEDGYGISYRNVSQERSLLVLLQSKDASPAGRLAVTFPEPDLLVLEGPLDGQNVKMTLRKVPPSPKKDYLLKNREFKWVQEYPFNR